MCLVNQGWYSKPSWLLHRCCFNDILYGLICKIGQCYGEITNAWYRDAIGFLGKVWLLHLLANKFIHLLITRCLRNPAFFHATLGIDIEFYLQAW